MVLRELFSDIAEAIRERVGMSGEIRAADFPERIRSLSSGSKIELEGLGIMTGPEKTTYSYSIFTGEAFEPKGMELEATVGDGDRSFSFPVGPGDVAFEPDGQLPAGTKSVTALFCLGNWEVMAEQAVTVEQRPAYWSELESVCTSWEPFERLVSSWGTLEGA